MALLRSRMCVQSYTTLCMHISVHMHVHVCIYVYIYFMHLYTYIHNICRHPYTSIISIQHVHMYMCLVCIYIYIQICSPPPLPMTACDMDKMCFQKFLYVRIIEKNALLLQQDSEARVRVGQQPIGYQTSRSICVHVYMYIHVI